MRPLFLVIERDPIVSQDLCEILRASVVDADIRRAGDIDAGAAALAGVERVALVLAHVKPADLTASGLADRVDDLGGAIVFVNADAGGQDHSRSNWFYLSRPFSEAMITAMLRRLAPRWTVGCGDCQAAD